MVCLYSPGLRLVSGMLLFFAYFQRGCDIYAILNGACHRAKFGVEGMGAFGLFFEIRVHIHR